jgi:Zn ribbon nucleic-acid-binding protein
MDMSQFGNGYIGQSMSVNASIAYENGEKPLSRWSKRNILDNIRKSYGEAASENCSKIPMVELRLAFLKPTCDHHCGKYFNPTTFYSFDDSKEPSDVLAMKKIQNDHFKIIAEKPVVVWGLVSIVVWEGRFKNYRKPVSHDVVASWREINGESVSCADCGFYGRKRDFLILKRLPKKPRKNARIYKEEN